MASEPRMVEATTTVMEVDFGSRQGPLRGQPGQFGPAAVEANEAAEPIGVFPEESEGEPASSRPPRRWAGGLLVMLAVAAFGGVVWFAYKWGLSSGYRDEIPTLMADARPVKVKPENPGGMVVPNQDKMVLHQSEEGSEQPVERLLSEPEVPEPLEPPQGTGPEIASITETEATAAASAAAEATGTETSDSAAAAPEAAPSVPAPAEPAPPAPAVAEAEPAAVPEPAPEPTATASQSIEASAAPAAGGGASAGAAAGQAAGGASGAASGGGAGSTTLAQAAGLQVAAIQKGDYVIQLASVTSSDAASQEWSRLQKTFPSLLGDMSLAVQQATVKGTLYHRVQTGPFPSRATAQDMCAQIKAKKQACIVQRR